jgi:hypothetical protein
MYSLKSPVNSDPHRDTTPYLCTYMERKLESSIHNLSEHIMFPPIFLQQFRQCTSQPDDAKA